MLTLRKKVAAASNPADKMIDRLVALRELYGLSEGEVKVVEEQT